MNIAIPLEQVIESFETWYKKEYIVREGARGRASKHLMVHNDHYISDHAADCFKVWCAGIQAALVFKGE